MFNTFKQYSKLWFSSTYVIFYITIASSSILWNKYIYPKSITIPPPVKKLTSEELYILYNKQAFLDTFENTNFNDNIDKSLYNKEFYNEIIIDKDNALELTWKQHILHELTPKGNIIMFYDVYKHAFTYYSDVYVPYSILNSVAMKYVIMFLCRDFFIDENEGPVDYLNSYFSIHHKIDCKIEKNNKIDVNNGPFVKFKKYTHNDKNNDKEYIKDKGAPNKVKSGECMQNKFISLGTIHNFKDLVKKDSTLNDKPILIPTKPIKYSDFKSWKNPDPHQSSDDNVFNHFKD
jgi:hypothetical protein